MKRVVHCFLFVSHRMSSTVHFKIEDKLKNKIEERILIEWSAVNRKTNQFATGLESVRKWYIAPVQSVSTPVGIICPTCKILAENRRKSNEFFRKQILEKNDVKYEII